MKSLLAVAKTLRSRARLIRITQDALAKSAGFSRRTMGHVLRGERDFKVSTLMSVADALFLDREGHHPRRTVTRQAAPDGIDAQV